MLGVFFCFFILTTGVGIWHFLRHQWYSRKWGKYLFDVILCQFIIIMYTSFTSPTFQDRDSYKQVSGNPDARRDTFFRALDALLPRPSKEATAIFNDGVRFAIEQVCYHFCGFYCFNFLSFLLTV